MKTMIHPIALSKAIVVQNITIGNKKSILNSNIKFAVQIISKHSSIGEYDFNFGSFVFLGLNGENAHRVVQTAEYVIDFFITMNHFNMNPSLQVGHKEYFEELKGQITYYLNQLQVWSESHYQYFQLLYNQISGRFLGEQNQKGRQALQKQLFQAKFKFTNWRETLENKTEKKKERNSLSRPFYQMMYQFMQSKKTLDYKEIWKLSIPSKLRLEIEKQKHQYIKYWNAMDYREQEIIDYIFATHKITSYLPNQILSMKEAEWIQFVETTKASAKEYHDGMMQNNIEFMKLKLINLIRETDREEFQNEIIQLIHHNSQLSQIAEKLRTAEHGQPEKTKLTERRGQQEKLIECIKNLKNKEWELLLSDFNKYSIEKGKENLRSQSVKEKHFPADLLSSSVNRILNPNSKEEHVHNDLWDLSESRLFDSKIQFIGSVENIEKPEELQAVIHLLFQNLHQKEDIEFFQQGIKRQLERSQFQILQSETTLLKTITEFEDIVTKKQKLKELIYQMNREKWDSLCSEMINYSKEQSVKEKHFPTDLLGSSVKEKQVHTDLFVESSVFGVVGDFFERIELLSEEYKVSLQGQPEEIQTISYKNQLLESIGITKKTEELQGMLYLLMENTLLKKEAEKFGVFQETKIEIQKQNLIEFISYMDLKSWETLLNEMGRNKIQSQDSLEKHFHADLLSSSVKKYEKQSYHMHRVNYQPTEEESAINKTQFLDFLETIENAEELQNIIHLLLQNEHLKNQIQSFNLLEIGQNGWEQRITGDEESEYREVDLPELNHESLVLYKQNLKEFIRNMDLKNWKTFLHEISVKEKHFPTDLFGNISDKSEIFMGTSVKEKHFPTDLFGNISDKSEIFMGSSMKEKHFRTGIFDRYIEQFSHIQNGRYDLTEAAGDRAKFLDFLETIESAEELQNIIHLLLQNEHLKNQIQSFNLLEIGQNGWEQRITEDGETEYREVDLPELNHKSLILHKQNLKEFIQNMDLKNWEILFHEISRNRIDKNQSSLENHFHSLETFFEQIEMFSEEYRDNSAEQTKEMQNFIYKAKFLNSVEVMESQEELQALVHLLMGNPNMKEEAEGFGLPKNSRVGAKSNQENLMAEKQKLKKFISNLDSEKWEILYGEIRTFEENNVQRQGLLGVIKDYFSRIELFNEKFKEELSSKTEEIKLLSYKTQFMESIGSVKNPEELQSLIHFMAQDTQLEKQTEAFRLSLSEEMERIGHREEFIAQKYNLKEWVGYMDSAKWVNLYHRMENYNHDTVNKKRKADESIRSTYLFKQYHKQTYDIYEYKEVLKNLQQLTERKDKHNTKEIVNMVMSTEIQRRSGFTLYMKSGFDKHQTEQSVLASSSHNLSESIHLQAEHSFLAFYQPVQLVATQPVSAYGRQSSNITPGDITYNIQDDIRKIETTVQERVEDIGRIVKQKHSAETTADFSGQLESVVQKMEMYHKEMEQIKSCQSKLLQSTNSNQIVNKVMKQLQGQLKVERMRRGLDR